MKRKRFILFLTIFYASISFAAIGTNNFYFSQLGVKDGLSQTSIICIFQDSDGYLWFGTRNGANKYDGQHFTIYEHEVNNPASVSDGYICAITEDTSKNIWLGTNNGLNCIDGQTGKITRIYPQDHATCATNTIGEFMRHQDGTLYAVEAGQLFRCNPDKTIEPVEYLHEITSPIYCIQQGGDGDIYIGTTNSEFYIYSASWELKKKHENLTKGNRATPSTINCILEITDRKILLGTETEGLYMYDKEEGTFRFFDQQNSSLVNNSVRALTQCKEKGVLIGTFGGLHYLNLTNNEIYPINLNMDERGSLSHFSIHSLLIDKHNTLWVGTYSAGINFYSPYYKPSHTITPHEFTGTIGFAQEDKEGNMWFATEGAGLLFHDIHSGEEKLYPLKPISSLHYEQNILKSILLRGDTIYCTTHFGSVYLFSIPQKRYKKLYDFKQFDIFSLYIDSAGRLWIPTFTDHHLVRIDKGEKTSQFPANGGKVSFPQITVINELSAGIYLFGSLRDSIYLYNSHTETVCNLAKRLQPEGKQESLGSISSIQKDKQHIWIATTRSGVYKLDHKLQLIKQYHKEDGLPGSYISSLVIDKKGGIWAATNNGIYKLNIQKDLFLSVRPPHIIPQEYTRHAGFVSSSGTVYFPGNKAIHVFEPQHLQLNPYIPFPYITGIRHNREDITTQYLTKKEISENRYTYYLKLPHFIKNISIHYTSLNFIHSSGNEFLLKLDGIDKDWVAVGNKRDTYYSNLHPGRYVFHLKAANIDGAWTPGETLLYITVSPPLYKTWWAYILYLLTATFILIWFIRYQQQKQELKRDLHYKQLEKEKMNELHDERIRMFQSFSHELRTPLTLIINPLNDLLKESPFSPEVKQTLNIMRKNTKRLLLLVNNLMDIQKYEAGQYFLNKRSFDLSLFIQEIHRSFESVASNRGITFTLHNELPEHYFVNYDPEELEKVLFNLLSNAFKFTPSQGDIKIICKSIPLSKIPEIFSLPDTSNKLFENNYLYIEVKDSGKGFPPEDANRIFSPFYQVGKDIHKEISGTGIGLSLTRSIILKHEGHIWATSSQGQGSSFRVLLPDLEAQPDELPEEEKDNTTIEKVSTLVEKAEAKGSKSILLVEDNRDIIEYLEKFLEEKYIVYKAGNGKEALDRMEEHMPDLVISDIRMPEMNGLELCRQIKESSKFQHIPVILLTSIISHIQEGLAAEADDYITKPFDVSVLKARIQNILSLRDKMKTVYGDEFSLKKLGLDQPNGQDEFLCKYIEIVKAHLSDPDLDISIIYNALNMSRPTFYRKVKTLTGLSPNEVITYIRLETSIKLLKETDMTITEIAQAVGFNSRSYFAKAFKQVYGMSPSYYQKTK